MKIQRFKLLAICSMAATFGAHAQGSTPEAASENKAMESPADISASAAADTKTASDQTADVGIAEVIVTARRKSESLQDVPQTVDAVSSDTLQKLNIQKFQDIQAVIPGLTMAAANNGYETSATIRGAAFNAAAGSSPTVEFYINDAPIQSASLFNSMFDVGQSPSTSSANSNGKSSA